MPKTPNAHKRQHLFNTTCFLYPLISCINWSCPPVFPPSHYSACHYLLPVIYLKALLVLVGPLLKNVLSYAQARNIWSFPKYLWVFKQPL